MRELVPRPDNVNMIRAKWVYRNKTNEHGNITRNKAQLVAQGYTQTEQLYFDETFVPITQLEFVRLLLPIVCTKQFILHQMDVTYLNGIIQDEAYVEQPKGFVNKEHPDYMYS